MRTPLIKAKNLGPVSAREFAQIGIHSLEDLQELGWKEACLRWVERFPARVNLNAFRSVIGAVYGVDWNQIPPPDDADAQRMIAELRKRKSD